MNSKFPVPKFVGAVSSFEAERRCMCSYKPDVSISRLNIWTDRVALYSPHTQSTQHTSLIDYFRDEAAGA